MQVDILTEYAEVKGVFVGGCVIRGEGSKFRALAHSHIGYGAKRLKTIKKKYHDYYLYYNPTKSEAWIRKQVKKEIDALGWICVRSQKNVYDTEGKPSDLMLHELAHILTGKGHTQEFSDKLRELGGNVPKDRYRFIE